MKKITKKAVTISLVLMGIGVLFIAAALTGGATLGDFNRTIRHRAGSFFVPALFGFPSFLGSWTDMFDEIGDTINDAFDEIDDTLDEMSDGFDGTETDFYGRKSIGNIENAIVSAQDYSQQHIDSVNIDVSAVLIDIKRADNFGVKIRQHKRRRVYSELQNGVLEIGEKGGFNWQKNRRVKHKAHVMLTIPENTALNELNIALNAGALYGSHNSLNVRSLSVDLNAGQIEINGGVTASQTDINCNVGQVRIAGKLRGKTKADCNVGQVELTIDSGAEEYSWHTHASLGGIRINDSTAAGFASNSTSGGGKKHNHLVLSAALGNIDVVIK